MGEPLSAAIDPQLPALALIPARGGSKGIPGKNLRPVGGIPLLARSVRRASSNASPAEEVMARETIRSGLASPDRRDTQFGRPCGRYPSALPQRLSTEHDA